MPKQAINISFFRLSSGESKSFSKVCYVCFPEQNGNLFVNLNMGVYSIKDLENFTRIKAHTLRIWEQRYNLLEPKRTDTNIRLYSDHDLKKILNINLLYTNGLKISKIAKLNDSEIFRLANEILMAPGDSETSLADRFINRIMRYDETGIRKDLQDGLANRTMSELFSDLIIPVLHKIGELWQVDSVTASHEHFFSNITRDFLITNTVSPPIPEKAKGKVVLFLREQEYHEIGLLFYNYILREKGYQTIYLGQAIPFHDFERAVGEINPHYIFTSLTAKMEKEEFVNFFRKVEAFFDLSGLYIGGYQLKIFEALIPKEVKVIHNVGAIDL